MVKNLQLKMLLVIGFTLLLLGIPPVHAAPITVPSGLNPGDPYRLVFVTRGQTQATSSNIYYYNSFVTAEAAASDQLWALRTEWTAIASTATVDALYNTDSVPGSTATDVPVYNLAGEMVASSYTDMWNGSLNSPIIYDTTGAASTFLEVWTGTRLDGYADDQYPLGAWCSVQMQYISWFALADASTGSWVYHDLESANGQRSLYGMSAILMIPQPIPAPTSILLFSSGIFGLLGLRRKGRKV